VKRHIPDPDALAGVLAGRVDQVEKRLTVLDQLSVDVQALARGLADVTNRVTHLAEATTGRILRGAGQTPAHATVDGGSAAAAEGESQRHWVAVTDPAEAIQWLSDAVTFDAEVLAPLGLAPDPACWVLHPLVVTELLALEAEYRASYAGQDPTPVCELLSRWLPGAVGRIRLDLKPCHNDRAHRHGGRAFEIPSLDPTRVAAWWADTHGTDPGPVEAFNLTPIR
jgi:hypothetical protein